MERTFYTTKEVATRLAMAVRTLYDLRRRHEVWRSDGTGAWHWEHVRILELVRSGSITEDEGLSFWRIARRRMRREVEAAYGEEQEGKVKATTGEAPGKA